MKIYQGKTIPSLYHVGTERTGYKMTDDARDLRDNVEKFMESDGSG